MIFIGKLIKRHNKKKQQTMATLRAELFELDFSYYDLNDCNEIVYSFDLKFLGHPFFNPEIINERFKKSDKGFDKFLISDCFDNMDWLIIFFVEIKKTRKGGKTSTIESPVVGFEAITWEDKRKEREERWAGKTVGVGLENGVIVNEPYSEVAKLFEPLWENNIDLIIELPYEYFAGGTSNGFKLTVNTNFDELTSFLEDFIEEMELFYIKFSDRIKYKQNGIYEVIYDEQ